MPETARAERIAELAYETADRMMLLARELGQHDQMVWDLDAKAAAVLLHAFDVKLGRKPTLTESKDARTLSVSVGGIRFRWNVREASHG